MIVDSDATLPVVEVRSEVQANPKKVVEPSNVKEIIEIKRPLEMHKVHYGNTIKLKELPPEIDFSKPRIAQQEVKENNKIEEKLEGPSVYELPKEIENLMYPKSKEVYNVSPPKERIREANLIVQKEVKQKIVKDKSVLNYGKIKGAKKPSKQGHEDHNHHDHGHNHGGRMKEKRKLKQIDISHHENSYFPF